MLWQMALLKQALFIAFLWCTILLLSFGQPPVSLPVTLLDLQAGMANEGNYFCYKDSHDFLWMSSYGGLHRFDGKNIKVYLPDPTDSTSIKGKEVVSFLCEDKKGNIWFGTERALNCFIRQTGHFKHYQFSEQDIGEYKVQGIDHNGAMWFTFNGGIYTLDIETKEFIQKAIIDLNELRGEVVLMTEFQLNEKKEVIRTFSYGSYLDDPGLEIHRFENGELKEEQICFGPTAEMPLSIRDVFVFKDSVLLIAAFEGLYALHLTNKSIQQLWPGNQIKDSRCTGIVPYSDSTLLVATLASQYFEFNPVKKKVVETYVFTQYGTELKDVPRFVNWDHDGAIYIHLQRRGLAYFHPKNLLFKHRKYPVLKGNQPGLIVLRGLIETDDKKVFGSSMENGGFLFAENGKLEATYNAASAFGNRLPRNNIISPFKDSQGRIWMLIYGRFLSYFDDNQLSHITSHKVDNLIGCMAELPSGQFVFGPRNGGLHLKDSSDSQRFRRVNQVDSTWVVDFIDLHPNGLLYVSANRNYFVALDPADDFKVKAKILMHSDVHCFEPIKSSNDFLLGTGEGVYYYDDSAQSLKLLDYCKCGNSAMIFSLLPIGDNKYLLSSDKGVCTLDLLNKESILFGVEHGLGMKRFNRFAAIKHSNGSIWLGNNSGITTCDPRFLDKPEFNNQVNITRVLINDEEVKELKTFADNTFTIEEIQELRVPFRSNTISFAFAAMSYTGIDQHLYEHRLNGYDRAWIDGGDRGFARYANLPPGNYTFEARITGQPTSMRNLIIVIPAPLHLRIWFQLLLIALIISFIYYLFHANTKRRQRLEQLKFERRLALEQERVRIATDMHDEIGSGLSALNMRTQMLVNQVDESSLKSHLEQLAASSRQLTQKIREIIWTVNAQNDTVENLVTTLHQYAQEYFSETSLACSFDLPGIQDNLPIAGNHRREIFLAFKEALHNILKHARATKVQISIEIKNNSLHIEISDNGIGFDPTHPTSSGNGLISMQKRMNRINGSFGIASQPGSTTIQFVYPFLEE